MKIEKGVTKDFETFEVFARRTVNVRQWNWRKGTYFVPTEEEFKLTHVVEADDESGQVVQQIVTEEGLAIYTNGKDEVILESAVKVLLLMGQVRNNFLAAGYRPKLVNSYHKNVRIVRSA